MRRVSRNALKSPACVATPVTPRMRRVSRNVTDNPCSYITVVTPRMRRVSRNFELVACFFRVLGHASHEACE